MSVLPTVKQAFQGTNPRLSGGVLRLDQVIACWLVGLAMLLEGAINPVQSTQYWLSAELPISDIPVLIDQKTAQSPQISAASYVVLDLNSASTLVASQSTQSLYPASTLKLLTALTILNQWPPDHRIQISSSDLELKFEMKNDLVWQVGELVTIRDLLASLLIHSDNLSAQILAAHYPTGSSGFLADMQSLAANLKLSPSLKIANAIGFDASGQLLSAHDLTVLARAALAQPEIKSLVAMRQAQIIGQNGLESQYHFLRNTNQLLWSDPTILGVKTGTTELAGEVLITLTEIQTKPIMVVVMGSHDRYQDTTVLLNWVKQHYRWQSWSDVAYNGSLK